MDNWMWAEGDTFKMNGRAYEIAAGIRGLQIRSAKGLNTGGSYVQDIWQTSPEVTFGEHWLDIGTDFRHMAKTVRRIEKGQKPHTPRRPWWRWLFPVGSFRFFLGYALGTFFAWRQWGHG